MHVPFQGRKTYVVAGLMVLYGVAGFLVGKLDGSSAVNIILEGLAIIGLRLAI